MTGTELFDDLPNSFFRLGNNRQTAKPAGWVILISQGPLWIGVD
jgi:hypothetical protein